jgi:hypothetical protein
MASYYASITEEQAALIRNAPVFFVATADPHLAKGPHGIGPVNLSPKGGVRLHILSPNRIAFLDHAGSGNETARHSLAGGPITVMVCSFEAEHAAIVRLYGTAHITPVADSPIAELLLQETTAHGQWPLRHVIEIAIESTVTSCGYGVPVMAFRRARREADRGRRYKTGKASSHPVPVLP